MQSLTNSFNSDTQDIYGRRWRVGPLQTASWAAFEWGENIATRQEPPQQKLHGECYKTLLCYISFIQINVAHESHIIYPSHAIYSSHITCTSRSPAGTVSYSLSSVPLPKLITCHSLITCHPLITCHSLTTSSIEHQLKTLPKSIEHPMKNNWFPMDVQWIWDRFSIDFQWMMWWVNGM